MKFKLFVFETEDDGDYHVQRTTTTLLQQHPEGIVWDEVPDSDRNALKHGIMEYNTRSYPFKRRIVCVEYPPDGLLPEIIKSGNNLIEKFKQQEAKRVQEKEERLKKKEIKTKKQKIEQLKKLKIELGEK